MPHPSLSCPAWVGAYFCTVALTVPPISQPTPAPEVDPALPGWLSLSPSPGNLAVLELELETEPEPEHPVRRTMRPLADLPLSDRLAFLRLFPVLHAAQLGGLALFHSEDPVLIETNDRAAVRGVENAVKALAKAHRIHTDEKGGAEDIALLTWAPKSPRDGAGQEGRLIEQVAKALVGPDPLIMIAASRGSLPAPVRDLPWRVLRTGAIERDRITAFLVERATRLQKDWAEIRDSLPDDAALRGIGDLGLLQALRPAHLDKVGEALHRAARIAQPQFTLDDFAGYGSVYTTAVQIANDLRALAEGRLATHDIARNALFYGPPGTGKTLIAQAIGAAAGVPVMSGSLAEWQAKGHMGDLLNAMFETFGKAAAAAPAVLIIDEIDAFGRRGDGERNENYRAQVIAGILQLLDGLYTPEGVMVIACCNHPEAMDPALQRAGRFDLKLRVEPPPPEALARILRRHLGDNLPGAESNLLALLPGRSPADIAGAVRAASAMARGDRGLLSVDHLRTALNLGHDDPAARRRVAIHEAGHAIVTWQAGFDRIVSITAGAEGGHMLRETNRRPMVESDMMQELAILLAGRVAETMVLGEPSIGAGGGMASDLARATLTARTIEQACGMGSDGLVWSRVNPEAALPTALAAAVRSRLERAEAIARNALEVHYADLLALSAALEAEGHLSGNRVAVMLAGIPRPAAGSGSIGVAYLDMSRSDMSWCG